MARALPGGVRLGFFSLGVVCPTYLSLQFFFVPVCWWIMENSQGLDLLRDVFLFFDIKGMEIFNRTSLWYSIAGVGAFTTAYFLAPAGAVRIRNSWMGADWSLPRAERLFWLFFLMGFAWKAVKVVAGLDVETAYIPMSIFANRYVAFFLSLNWFNTLALGIIHVAYREAKASSDKSASRLRTLAIAVTLFTLGASLTSGSEAATVFPLLTVLVIKQAYSPIPMLKVAWRVALSVCLLFIVKQLVDAYTQGDEAATDETNPLMFGLLFVLTYRVNMSHVLAGTISIGRDHYPNGTFGQFWVDMLPYGSQRLNVFDGNDFGRAIGVATETDFMTGVAVTNIGDFYLNWGLTGIIIGMLCQGVFYKMLVASCRSGRPSFILMYALLFPLLLHGLESPVSVLYATTIKMILMCLVIVACVAASGRRA